MDPQIWAELYSFLEKGHVGNGEGLAVGVPVPRRKLQVAATNGMHRVEEEGMDIAKHRADAAADIVAKEASRLRFGYHLYGGRWK